MPEENKVIWTIGHSTRTLEELLNMLKSFTIALVADVRHYPGSRKYPQFNKESLEITLPENNIGYVHLVDLGGRRKPDADSKNTSWRNTAFRGYADYMETDAFHQGMTELISEALKHRTACMCSEAVWWRCHRSMIADYLKARGWKVMHIMEAGKAQEHPYTAPARIIDCKLSYSA